MQTAVSLVYGFVSCDSSYCRSFQNGWPFCCILQCSFLVECGSPFFSVEVGILNTLTCRMPNSLELAFPTSKEESHGNETDNRVEHHVIQVPLSSLKLMGRGQLLEMTYHA